MENCLNTYKAAGVDRDAASSVKQRIAALARPTHGPEVIGGIGWFGGLFQLSSFRDPVLVSSTDGVGTKIKLAHWMDSYRSLGMDLVNANINDVIVCGARPLFFLDYIAIGKMEAHVVEELVAGMADACRQSECALIGGETAEMPSVYSQGEFDLAGFVVGAVERDGILDPARVQHGDVLIGLPSNGLHTNGYSLVRRIFNLDEDQAPLHAYEPELGQTLGEALLAPHLPYYPTLKPLLPSIKAMSHITGGGLVENMPRSLPEPLAARFDTASWDVPPIFKLIQGREMVDRAEMFRVFNMGLGMVLVCPPGEVDAILRGAPEAKVVGEVVKARGSRRVILD
ncbi:MAG: phosphoribosylformylglycinamidine cyclo-ligase [SAR202 cluster bacterium]|nr:phosphoribosylformylglycinamidine cyclo-ligase [SAR202 cluster bacterium]